VQYVARGDKLIWSVLWYLSDSCIYILQDLLMSVDLLNVYNVVEEEVKLKMWASAQRDGHPAKYRWRPLFNAAKFG